MSYEAMSCDDLFTRTLLLNTVRLVREMWVSILTNSKGKSNINKNNKDSLPLGNLKMRNNEGMNDRAFTKEI